YYVNDGTVNANGGDWTTAPGDNGNDGLSPASPKASIGAVFVAYHLSAGDVIRVDDGTYPLGVNLVLDASVSGVMIEGYHDNSYPARRALLDRGNIGFSSAAFEVHNAVNVTLDHLSITGGGYGIYG